MKDKQVEEILNDLCEADQEFGEFCRGRQCQECEYYFAKTNCKNQIFAEKLVDKGYRKASDLAREIIAYLKQFEGYACIAAEELEKKYTETEKDNG